ncbi:MAG: putative transposase, partial [Jiangellaceae bacterium]
TPARLPLGQVRPGQQVLDVETKLITHAIRIAAFNTATALARDLRTNTGYTRAQHEARTLTRQALTHTGDIDPTRDGVLTVRLDPMPTARATAAIAELCQHLTATNTTYPGTNLTMRYQIKTRP